jgi:hypothetical protein
MILATLSILLTQSETTEAKHQDHDPTDDCFTVFHDLYLLKILANARVERSPRNGEPLKAARSEVDFRSNELLAPRESARSAGLTIEVSGGCNPSAGVNN